MKLSVMESVLAGAYNTFILEQFLVLATSELFQNIPNVPDCQFDNSGASFTCKSVDIVFLCT